MTRTICGAPGGGRWVLANEGMGCYGLPENDPRHHWSIEEWRGSRSVEAAGIYSLSYAIEAKWIPESVKQACRELFDREEIDHA